MTRKKLYIILSFALAAGYTLLFYEFTTAGRSALPDLCLFKQFTGIPCPSCGSTRSAIALLHGNFSEALLLNPFGIIIAGIMFSTPPWMIFDLVTGRKTLFDVYLVSEAFLRKPFTASALICLVLSNWIWNIMKGA